MLELHTKPSKRFADTQNRIIRHYAQRHNVSTSEASAAWKELTKFLALCGSTQESLAPSKAIDNIWHEAILHTRDYAYLCRVIAKRFVHHFPTDGADKIAYQRTLAEIEKAYGKVNKRFWPYLSAADCDNCGSTCNDCGSKCSDQ